VVKLRRATRPNFCFSLSLQVGRVAHAFAQCWRTVGAKVAFQDNARYSAAGMPSRLKRYQEAGQLHYVTFTCYHRIQYLNSAFARDVFEQTLERVRRWYNLYIIGYVVMPEHVHLLLSEPERSNLAVALQMLKQVSSRKLHSMGGPPFRPLLAKGWEVEPSLSPAVGEAWGASGSACLAETLLRFQCVQ
jgi:REP element-mobilizing transposase RayT